MSFFGFIREEKSVRLSIMVAFIVWFLIAFLVILGFRMNYNIYFDQKQKDIEFIVASIIEDYELETHVFSALLHDVDESLTEEDFNVFASNVVLTDPSIEYIMLTRNSEARYVYPSNLRSQTNDNIIGAFTLDDFSKFQESIAERSCFVTYEHVSDDVADKVLFHHPILDQDGDFLGLVTIGVVAENIILQIPDDFRNDELALQSSDNVFIYGNEHKTDTFRSTIVTGDHISFKLSLDYTGSFFDRTTYMVMIASFIASFPVLIILALSIVDKRKITSYLSEISYSRKYSIGTGLKNERSFYLDVENYIKNNLMFFVALGNFNNIKYLNDKFGHELGKDFISQAIKLIQGVLRHNTEMYHLGGAEYAFVIKAEGSPEVVNTLKRVLKVFERDITMDRITTNISMSMGVVEYPAHGKNVDELIKNAHMTLSNSRIQNSNGFEFYKKDNVKSLLVNRDFDNMVKNLNLELFEVYMMPIIDVETNLIQGFECLTRAFNEFDDVLDTESVVNSLERNGRIQELDEIVFKKMLLMMRRINKEFDREFFLSVNASALSFNEKYVEKVMNLYELENFTKGTIVLELTESYQVDDYDYLIRLFKRLNRVGIKTAIDDFGSGYSSLSYISKFPIYAIKVDKEYVRDYNVNSFNRTLFMTLQSIAKVLDCKLVAEGVDDPDTLEFLKQNNCDMYQGYYFGKAVTFNDGIKMIKQNIKEYGKE